jgi:CRISPR-associated protein Csm3
MTIQGKVIITGKITTITGLHIGGASTGLEIGGVDKVVVRNPITNQPYIPGSSLKGKMRSLLERANGFAEKDKRVWVKKDEISMHLCNEANCYLCNIFGRNNAKMNKVNGSDPNGTIDIKNTTPTRLIVRDCLLVNVEKLNKAQTDLPFTEVKWEVGIDRITSQANPRQIERVPPGAEFNLELIYTVYEETDLKNLKYVFEALQWLEHDYLGGQGARGAGKVQFSDLALTWHPNAFYQTGSCEKTIKINGSASTVASILKDFDKIKEQIDLTTPQDGNADVPA